MGTSGTHVIFESVLKECVTALEGETGALAKHYKTRALDLLREFQGWVTEAPDTDVRAKTVQAILDLHREVQEYRTQKREPSG